MTGSIELQVISKILTSQDEALLDELCSYDKSYYSVCGDQIEFILDHREKYGSIPDRFTFDSEFPEFKIVKVDEPLEYLVNELKKNKRHILFLETFNKLKDMGSADVDDAWAYMAQQLDVADSLNAVAPMNIIQQAQERSDQVVAWSKQTRIPTGFAELDKLSYGGLSTVEELLVFVARTNTGKAQPLWSKVLTPSGWVNMGDIRVGDVVIGENNDNGRVVQIFPQGTVDYYKIYFNDGTYAECCGNHLWKVANSSSRIRGNSNYGDHLILTTNQMLKDYKEQRYSVDLTQPVEFISDFDEETELDPYLLGVILGDGGLRDGSVTISNESEEIWARIESIITKYDCVRSTLRKDKCSIKRADGIHYKSNYVRDKLIEYGLMFKKSIDKFIPKQYLTAPVHVRKALLAGLLDTDGYSDSCIGACWEFDTASDQLAQDFVELARSLGVFVMEHARKSSYYTTVDGVRHKAHGSINIRCRSDFNPFYFSKKANRYRFNSEGSHPSRKLVKMIDRIEYAGKTECQCIMLDNESHTYITDNYTITHNTWMLTRIGEAANRAGFNVAYYSPEMQSAYLATRFDTWRGHYQNSKLFTGQYTPEYIDYLKKLPAETNADFYIIEDKDMPEGVSPRHLSAFVKKHNIQLLIIDGISYMVDDRKGFSDHEKYGNICHDLFQLSKKYGCAVVVAAQANRETKDSKDDKGVPFPTIYNIAGSDAIGQIATQVYSLRQIFDKHVFEIRLEKSRMAVNENNTLSYSWDVNNGNMQYLPGGPDEDPMINTPEINTSELVPSTGPVPDIIQGLDLTDDEDSGLEW